MQFAYVDESGDPYLDITKSGTSRFYVITAVLVDASRKDELIAYADEVRATFFGNGEMKSSAVGGDTQRRRDILSALLKADFKFCAYIADKSQIDHESGLQYKRSFIKYLHGRLYRSTFNNRSTDGDIFSINQQEYFVYINTRTGNNMQQINFDHAAFDSFILFAAAF